MSTQNLQVKPKTSLDKIKVPRDFGRLKSTELLVRDRAKDARDVPLVPSLSSNQQRSGIHTRSTGHRHLPCRRPFVPVVDGSQKPLMPTRASRASSWIRNRKATPFWKNGVFCVRLNREPSGRNLQPIVVGIDPGSKREAFTAKSRAHTYLNVLTEAVGWVKKAIEQRKNARSFRRQRNCPCRPNRSNRKKGGIPPSTRARWGAKLRIIDWLLKMLPVSGFVVEDIKAKTTGRRKWDASFSPLEVGKQWFYSELGKRGTLGLKQGYETKELRDLLGLKKSQSKLADRFACHNIDSWVLANDAVGGHSKPENVALVKLIPLQFHRRQLHVFTPSANGMRKAYGGTRSLGLKRGSLIKYQKKVCHVGGTRRGKISLHDQKSFKRITQNAQKTDLKFLSYCSWRYQVR